MQDKKLYALHNGFFANVRTQIVTIRVLLCIVLQGLLECIIFFRQMNNVIMLKILPPLPEQRYPYHKPNMFSLHKTMHHPSYNYKQLEWYSF